MLHTEAKRVAKMAHLSNLHKAAKEFNSLKMGTTLPEGKRDNAGRFYPDNRCACCQHIRTPSRAFPDSLKTHVKSAVHIASVYEVEPTDLKFIAKLLKKEPHLNDLAAFHQDFGFQLTSLVRSAIDDMLSINGLLTG
jgi:hypothetical protein